jgi:hypothetical protein
VINRGSMVDVLGFPTLLSKISVFTMYLIFDSLDAFTASFFNCSHSLSHHSFFFPVPFAPLTIISFFVVAFPIISFSSTVIFSTSCSSNLTFSSLLLYSSTLCSSHIFIVPSSASPLLFLFPYLHGSFLLY